MTATAPRLQPQRWQAPRQQHVRLPDAHALALADSSAPDPSLRRRGDTSLWASHRPNTRDNSGQVACAASRVDMAW